MAGILSRVIGEGATTPTPTQGNPAPSANVVVETEYSFFIKLTELQLKALLDRYENNPYEVFLEGKLPGRGALRPRIRQWLKTNGDFDRAALETKISNGDGKIEHPDSISQVNFRALTAACDVITSRIRIKIPILRADGSAYVKSNGQPLEWEVDLFYNPVFDGSLNNWIKLELEVDRLSMPSDDVVSLIPFDYDQLIASNSNDAGDRKLIEDLYSIGYNIATNATADYEMLPAVISKSDK